MSGKIAKFLTMIIITFLLFVIALMIVIVCNYIGKILSPIIGINSFIIAILFFFCAAIAVSNISSNKEISLRDRYRVVKP